jgi:hypothetical protein
LAVEESAAASNAFYDIAATTTTTTTNTTNSSDNNNDDDRQQPSTPALLLDCGCCSGKVPTLNNNQRFLLNEYPPDGSQVLSGVTVICTHIK